MWASSAECCDVLGDVTHVSHVASAIVSSHSKMKPDFPGILLARVLYFAAQQVNFTTYLKLSKREFVFTQLL